MTKSARSVRARLLILLGGFALGYGVLVVRDVQLLFESDERLAKLEGKQRVFKERISEKRGTIYDRNGRILATSIKVPSVYADPKVFSATDNQLKSLSKVLGISPKELKKKLGSKKRFVWLKRFLDPSKESALVSLDIDGLGITQEWKRFYPEKELAGQVLGAVNADGRGLEGLERYFDTHLRSEERTIRAERDARGRAILTGDDVSDAPVAGASLYLTLDSAIQYNLEKELSQAARSSGTDVAFGIVMDPHDGSILAMASYPQVDPNRPEKYPLHAWRNRVVQEIFEPGSTFKVFTLATALEAGTLKEDQSILCSSGSLVLGKKSIRNDSNKGDWLTPRSILKFSNNIGTARIGLDLGPSRIAQTLLDLGFGKKTGIEFPGEPAGLMAHYTKWKSLDLANISFGHGVGVTALQLSVGVSAIANGGYKLKPRIISQWMRPEGSVSQASMLGGGSRERIFSERTVSTITDFMEAVLEPEGTGRRARIPGYRVAGKTGTAQMLDPKTGRYSHSMYTSSFVGFLPASQPKLVGMMVFRAPKNSMHGGEIAAPVFQRVMSAAARYLHIKPDDDGPIYEKSKVTQAQMLPVPKPKKRSRKGHTI